MKDAKDYANHELWIMLWFTLESRNQWTPIPQARGKACHIVPIMWASTTIGVFMLLFP